MKKAFLTTIGVIILAVSGFCEDDFDFKSINYKKQEINLKEPSLKAQQKQFPQKVLMVRDENGNYIILNPTATFIDENGNKTNYYVIPPNYVGGWKIWCPGSGSWSAKLTYSQCHDKCGGHYHYSPQVPYLRYGGIYEQLTHPQTFYYAESPIYFPTMTGDNKKYYYYFWYPAHSEQITSWIESFGACHGMITDVISVKVDNLEELKEGEGYILTGRTSIHPYNHYVTSSFGKTLKEIGKEWKQICPQSKPLEYNDASLPWGGLFDIKGNWQPPHKGHRYGVEIDISKRRIRKGNREKVIRMMCKYTIVYSEGNEPNEVPHYHVVSKKAPQEVFKELEEMVKQEKIIPCCPASSTDTIPAACINLESGGQTIPEDDDVPIETDCPGLYTPTTSIGFSPGWIKQNGY